MEARIITYHLRIELSDLDIILLGAAKILEVRHLVWRADATVVAGSQIVR